MKHTLRIIALCLPLALPLGTAQAQQTPNTDVDEGLSLLEQGAQMLLRGMMSEMEPALDGMADDMAKALDQAKPMLDDLMALMGEVQNYHAPEMLPNGDIIIRRKLPGEIAPAPEVEL